jgi:hypothetical protein
LRYIEGVVDILVPLLNFCLCLHGGAGTHYEEDPFEEVIGKSHNQEHYTNAI